MAIGAAASAIFWIAPDEAVDQTDRLRQTGWAVHPHVEFDRHVHEAAVVEGRGGKYAARVVRAALDERASLQRSVPELDAPVSTGRQELAAQLIVTPDPRREHRGGDHRHERALTKPYPALRSEHPVQPSQDHGNKTRLGRNCDPIPASTPATTNQRSRLVRRPCTNDSSMAMNSTVEIESVDSVDT